MVRIVLSAFTLVFSLGLLIVSLLSYRRYRNGKLVFVSLVFLVFLVKGMLLSLSVFSNNFSEFFTNPYLGFLDVCALVFLFLATLRR